LPGKAMEKPWKTHGKPMENPCELAQNDDFTGGFSEAMDLEPSLSQLRRGSG